ncbi:MAG: hypothetical protein JW699_06435 [Chitinispirillaceae bacterium]|nr:hypothetical protein [Chitinispirillaceae bacterium]
MKNRLAICVTSAFILCIIASCGVSDKMLEDADRRLAALKAKGLPDSVLAQPQVHLYQARDAKKRSQYSDAMGEARAAAKLLKKELVKAESYYQQKVSKLKPKVDSLIAVIKKNRDSFTGLTLKRYDSLSAIVDSFSKRDWLLQAYSKGQELAAVIPQFNADMARARELRGIVPGEWVCTQRDSSLENKDIKSVTRKVFTFGKDGKAKFVESKKGQSGLYLKEDWEFDSYGTWDLAGDTVHLFVDRFAAVRQMFERMYILEGGKKKEWRKEPKPTYDSAITDGSQNRYISFTDLKEDFEQTKKFK